MDDVRQNSQRERIANEFAGRLLLPTDWLLHEARSCDWDVPTLKESFCSASHELILTGLLRVETLTMVTIFDHGRVTRRKGNGQLPPPSLLPLEKEIWRSVHESGGSETAHGEGIRVQGWAIHEPGWKRELLRTTATEFCDD